MIVVEYHDIELDMCTECKGVWFDSGEMELMLKTHQAEGIEEFLEEMRNSPDAKTSEKKRKCPICLKKMEKIMAGVAEPAILLDKCRKEHGLWFDSGELQDIVKSGSFDKENKVNRLLDDMFGGQT